MPRFSASFIFADDRDGLHHEEVVFVCDVHLKSAMSTGLRVGVRENCEHGQHRSRASSAMCENGIEKGTRCGSFIARLCRASGRMQDRCRYSRAAISRLAFTAKPPSPFLMRTPFAGREIDLARRWPTESRSESRDFGRGDFIFVESEGRNRYKSRLASISTSLTRRDI